MIIEVFGTGCAKCNSVKAVVKETIERMGLDMEIQSVRDVQEIIERGVFMTPALVIDGDVKIAGRVPTTEEVEQLLK